MKTPIVHVAGLHKAFGKQPVLQGVNWTIEPGTIVGLLGRNGAGKSTLLECLLGLREADRGAPVARALAGVGLSRREVLGRWQQRLRDLAGVG